MSGTRPFSTERPRPTTQDVLIGVMGEAGVGKSALIRRLARQTAVTSDSIDNGDQNIYECTVTVPSPEPGMNYTVRFVDLPGFNDINTDNEMDNVKVRRILRWLAREYGHGQKLHGIIYMISINNTRVTGFAQRNMSIFRALVGRDFYPNLVLGTSFWDEVNEAEGSRREQRLIDRLDIWGELYNGGAQVRRIGREAFDDHPPSPDRMQDGYFKSDLLLVHEIGRHHPQWTAAQLEMGSGIPASQTTAGRRVVTWRDFYRARDQWRSQVDDEEHSINDEFDRHRRGLESERRRLRHLLEEELSLEEVRDIEAGRLREQEDFARSLARQTADQAHTIRATQRRANALRDDRRSREAESEHKEEQYRQTRVKKCARFRDGSVKVLVCSKKGCETKIRLKQDSYYREYHPPGTSCRPTLLTSSQTAVYATEMITITASDADRLVRAKTTQR